MGALWVVVGVGVASLGLGIWLFVRVLTRRRYGRSYVASVYLSLFLLFAATVLLCGVAAYVQDVAQPNVAAESTVLNRPAPVDASATIFYLSLAWEGPIGTPHTSTDMLIGVAARTGAIRWQRALPSDYLSLGGRREYAVADDVAYVATITGYGTTVAAYRGADGTLLWQTRVSSYVEDIAASGDTVYVNTANEIHALRAADSTQRWSSATPVDHDSPGRLIAGPDAVYLATNADEVHAYRASDGKPLWTRSLLDARVRVPPVVAGVGTTYLPHVAVGGSFSAVRTSDGSTICEASDQLDADAIVLAGNTLYVAAQRRGVFPAMDEHGRVINPETVYAYDAVTCTLLWRYATASNGYIGTAAWMYGPAPALITGDNMVYVNAADGIYALRAADGKLLWHRDAVNTRLPLRSAGWTFNAQPAVRGDTLFATSPLFFGSLIFSPHDGQEHIFAIAPDGSDYWHIPIGHVITFPSHVGF